MATIKTGNLMKKTGAYTQPLAANKIPRPGQFANQIRPVVSLTGAGNVARPGALKVQAAPRPVMRIQGSAGRSTQADGVLGGQFGNQPQNQVTRWLSNSQNISAPAVPTPAAPTAFNRATTPLVNLTGEPNARGVQQYRYLTPQQKSTWDARKRREQITALTSPYTGSVAALTGANMVEPTQTGFPGTDPRQRYPVSQQYLTGVQQPQAFVEPSLVGTAAYTPTPAAYSPDSGYGYRGGSYGGGGYGRGGSYGGGSYAGSQSAAYQDSLFGRVMSWRVATG